MKRGFLSEYFVSAAAKRLSAVETDPNSSNQHEFNGSQPLKKLFGLSEPEKFVARFIWLGQENESVSADGFLTWYDARKNHPTRTEYRLYFPTNEVMDLASPGDFLFLARRTDNSILVIITALGSTLERQLQWLFGIEDQTTLQFTLNEFENEDDVELDFATRLILEELGIDIEEPETDRLDDLLAKFKGGFPTTKIFSAYARETVTDVPSLLDDPDGALMAWMDHEEKLFRRMERHLVDERLRTGFVDDDETDVDGFLQFSLSVQNRRKSRVGHALENHLEELFLKFSLMFDRGVVTENNSRPDFLFPGRSYYALSDFDGSLLTMLGVKTTCKDRWRQVLAEAVKIPTKHLLTLEPAISTNQTDEMVANKLQLIVPTSLHSSYTDDQRKWLLNVREFIGLTLDRQKRGIDNGDIIEGLF